MFTMLLFDVCTKTNAFIQGYATLLHIIADSMHLPYGLLNMMCRDNVGEPLLHHQNCWGWYSSHRDLNTSNKITLAIWRDHWLAITSQFVRSVCCLKINRIKIYEIAWLLFYFCYPIFTRIWLVFKQSQFGTQLVVWHE